jgi:hypothetical protein
MIIQVTQLVNYINKNATLSIGVILQDTHTLQEYFSCRNLNSGRFFLI